MQRAHFVHELDDRRVLGAAIGEHIRRARPASPQVVEVDGHPRQCMRQRLGVGPQAALHHAVAALESVHGRPETRAPHHGDECGRRLRHHHAPVAREPESGDRPREARLLEDLVREEVLEKDEVVRAHRAGQGHFGRQLHRGARFPARDLLVLEGLLEARVDGIAAEVHAAEEERRTRLALRVQTRHEVAQRLLQVAELAHEHKQAVGVLDLVRRRQHFVTQVLQLLLQHLAPLVHPRRVEGRFELGGIGPAEDVIATTGGQVVREAAESRQRVALGDEDVQRQAHLQHLARALEERANALRLLRQFFRVAAAGHEVGARDRHHDAVEWRIRPLAPQHVQQRVPTLGRVACRLLPG